MIKKYLLGLFVGIVGIINFSNGYDLSQDLYVREIGPYAYSPYENNYDISVIKYGTPLTQQIGVTKPVLYLQDGTYFLRKYNNVLGGVFPYMSSYQSGNNYIQGFPLKYAICNEFTGTHIGDYDIAGCSVYDMNNESYPIIQNIMNSITTNDYYAFKYDYNTYTYSSQYNTVGLLVCFSSSQYGKSLCFGIGNCKYSDQTIYPGYVLNNCGSPAKLAYSGYGVNLPLSFNELNRSDFDVSPGGNGGNGENNTNNNITINTNCPTIGQLMQNMGNNYNTGLCYNNTQYFNGTSFETVTKDDIFTIFDNNYENYVNRISMYRNNCNTPASPQNCQAVFSGEYKKYSIINNAINGGVDEKRLWNYCNMGLNYNPNATTCVASGYIKEEYTTEEQLEAILSLNNGIPIPGLSTTGQENNVFNALCDPNDPTNCYGTGNVRDIFGSLQNIYAKITGIFKERNGVNGIIPDYILWITMLTIVFTILLKK